MYSKAIQTLLFILILCSCREKVKHVPSPPDISFERIKYFRYPVSQNKTPFQTRLTYYFENGRRHRWMELDSLGRVVTDYIYEYDADGVQTGARYREESDREFSIERVRFKDDSTRITEWIDSTGAVYYQMIDNLNEAGNTYRAAFIGDKLHGYDSTFYTPEGFEKRIFFTNTKGKVFNDRSFVYDSINENGDWVVRKKIMQDTVRELQIREVYYGMDYYPENGKFMEGIISTGEASENVISFSGDEHTLFLTRTTGWEVQSGYISHFRNGLYPETSPVEGLDSIYNGAISPLADKIIYSVRKGEQQTIYLIEKQEGQWKTRRDITAASGIEGGYFHWFNEQEIYFYQDRNNGDIVLGELTQGSMKVVDSLPALNTATGTEFSPYVDKEKRFLILTRFEEGNASNQGFFVSYNRGDFNSPLWSEPKKLEMLPYGWSAAVIDKGKTSIYTDGDDIRSVPLESLDLAIK